jgi:hypothetical protein
MAEGGRASSPLLVSSTVRLHDVFVKGGDAEYDVEAFGRNVLVFRGTPTVTVRDEAGRAVASSVRTIGRHAYVDFEGRGRFRAVATATR